ncbi:myosin-binding protein 7 [Andrographis paniculata]|uniref:myosin-binding protein 7 n=1 Tax=Andrographis paniculata TaxID=175694 RepID=UPI0021E80E44|nr:myosin-binding protein 7 [Andrographis paniculata]
METGDTPSPRTPSKCCDCGCSCCSSNISLSGVVIRSVKRKFDEFEEENQFKIPGLIIPQNARVEIENECVALRETVSSQQETIQDLICELEEERNASSSATNETMSMILRLQREKAEIEMEAKQFKRFVEEKIAHDQQEMLELEEMLYKREHTIEALTCEIQAYKHRLMSYGLSEAEAEAQVDEFYLRNEGKLMSRDDFVGENEEGKLVLPGYEIYPPLRCKTSESHLYLDGHDEADDIEKHAFMETPSSRDELKDLEYRINQLENTPRTIQPDGEYVGSTNVFEKVIVGQSPSWNRNVRGFSNDNANMPLVKEMGIDAGIPPKSGGGIKKMEYLDLNPNLKKVDSAAEVGDDVNDRVYTVDSIHRRASSNGAVDHNTSAFVGGDDNMTTPRALEIQKLYARLHALEADRETMKQAIYSVGTDKAQLVLLKEIAQNLCKQMSPSRTVVVQEKSMVRSFSFVSLFKWVLSFLFWRNKARRSRYTFGLSPNNSGLLALLDRNPRTGPSRRITSTTNLRC